MWSGTLHSRRLNQRFPSPPPFFPEVHVYLSRSFKRPRDVPMTREALVYMPSDEGEPRAFYRLPVGVLLSLVHAHVHQAPAQETRTALKDVLHVHSQATFFFFKIIIIFSPYQKNLSSFHHPIIVVTLQRYIFHFKSRSNDIKQRLNDNDVARSVASSKHWKNCTEPVHLIFFLSRYIFIGISQVFEKQRWWECSLDYS